LRGFLSAENWVKRDIASPDRLLGDLVTTTTRMFLVGRTGLGKTLVGYALACGIATGQGFLHWRATRAGRVLYIDGEMPAELIKARTVEALRRASLSPPSGNLVIYSRDDEEAFARRFPALGVMPPLNTEAGHSFVLALVDMLGGVDIIIFDNVMSLVAGDQKDELAWAETMPLITALTSKRIGQIWLDHTGHAADRQYGSATKAWRFDTVGIMAPLAEDDRDRHEAAFTLSFDHPGKARRRTPDSWRDYEPCTIRLADDQWTSETTSSDGRPPKATVPPAAKAFHNALKDALAISPTPGTVTREAWIAECIRVGLLAPISDADTHHKKETKRAAFRKNLSALKVAGWVGVDGETIRNIAGDGTI